MDQTPSHTQYLSYLSFLLFGLGLLKIGTFLYHLFAPLIIPRLNLLKRYNGGWALVTGGSQGIGFAIAGQLAKQGFNIILVSRSESKLSAASNQLKELNPKILVESKSIDFQKITTQEDYRKSLGDILTKDISILVNNVGFYVPNKFASLTFQELRREMKVNCLPVSVLSRLFIEKMEGRSRSGIINLSSGSAVIPFAGIASYSATKKFTDFASQVCAYQFKDKIDILTARPYYVTTSMTNNTDSPMHTSSQKCAKYIVNSLGRRGFSYGPFNHIIQGVGTETFGELMAPIYEQSIRDFVKQYKKGEK